MKLSAIQQSIYNYLKNNLDRAVSVEELIDCVYGPFMDTGIAHNITQQIWKLRQKLANEQIVSISCDKQRRTYRGYVDKRPGTALKGGRGGYKLIQVQHG